VCRGRSFQVIVTLLVSYFLAPWFQAGEPGRILAPLLEYQGSSVYAAPDLGSSSPNAGGNSRTLQF